MKYLNAPRAAACAVATLAFVSSFAVAPARAQHLLTLPAAIELAVRGNPDVLIARREVEALEGDDSQAGHLPNPAIDYLREGSESGNGATTLQLSIPIELGGKRGARRQLAGAALDLGRHQLAATRARVRAETVAAYIELHLAESKLQLAQAGAELAATSTAMAARRVAAGKLSPVEESRARVAQANVRIDLLQAGRDRDMAHRRLISWLPPGTPAFDGVAPPTGALPRLPDLLELTSRLDAAPALVQARLEVARRAALSQVELARRTQDLTVLVGSKREHSAGAPANGRQLVLGLSVPLPLFDRNAGAVLASLRRLDKAQVEHAAALVRLRLDLEQAHARLATALQEAALIDADILPGARSAYDAAMRGFEAGKFSYLEVLDAQRSLFNARQQSVKAAGEAHRAAADIAILTGIDL